MPLYKVSIVPRGVAGGVTQLLPDEDEFMHTRKGLCAALRVAMAGRAAEEIVFGYARPPAPCRHSLQAQYNKKVLAGRQ